MCTAYIFVGNSFKASNRYMALQNAHRIHDVVYCKIVDNFYFTCAFIVLKKANALKCIIYAKYITVDNIY